ncbi:MAG TPA: hypothetical protein EYP03_03415 [Aquificae bacterium]|nr:hypothetical protein [Aquificota bacterium]
MKKIFLASILLFLGCSQTVKVNANKSNFKANVLKKNKEKEDKNTLYKQYLNYAARYITLGNFNFALKNIKEAEKYKTEEDPYFYEIRGVIYDALYEKDKAYNDFYKAMILYYQNENYPRALQMLAYLQAMRFGDPELEKWEKDIKLKLYQQKLLKEKGNEKN